MDCSTRSWLPAAIGAKLASPSQTCVDAGNTWNLEKQFCKTTPAPQFSNLVSPCFDSGSLGYLRWSTGFGIRWFSPLGPLRFEWGFQLNKLSYEESSVFEFTIGNFF